MGLGFELVLKGKTQLEHMIKRPWLLKHSHERGGTKCDLYFKEVGKIGNRPLCGKSALRGVAAFIRPQKAAEVGLLLEKDQDFMVSLVRER